MPCRQYYHVIQIVGHSLLRALKEMDMTPSQFTFTFLHQSAERQRDFAKEKGLVFQLNLFKKTMKATFTKETFLKSVNLTL